MKLHQETMLIGLSQSIKEMSNTLYYVSNFLNNYLTEHETKVKLAVSGEFMTRDCLQAIYKMAEFQAKAIEEISKEQQRKEKARMDKETQETTLKNVS